MLNVDREQLKEKLFNLALEISALERRDFLIKECQGDIELQKEIESLIAIYEEEGDKIPSNTALINPTDQTEDLISWLIGKTLENKYCIEQLLGQGGMGAVYRATHLGTERPVAVKVISPEFMTNAEFVERFKREAKAAGLLRHPNVVNVTDFGFTTIGTSQIAYLVMEYLNGSTLGQLLREKGKLSLPLVIDIVEQVCLAMDEAHKKGIIHRDLKPDNIWLEPNFRGGYNVKVLDFGLAKLHPEIPPEITEEAVSIISTLKFNPTEADNPILANLRQPLNKANIAGNQNLVDSQVKTQPQRPTSTLEQLSRQTASNLTAVGTVLGTPLYMSPEQCLGKPLDGRSDIYSLGVIVYQMLSGKTPFTGNLYQLIFRHNELPPPPLDTKKLKINKAVAEVVMSALLKNSLDRPSTAMKFAKLLRYSAEGEIPIMRKAISFYREHLFKFLSISVPVYTFISFVNLLICGPIIIGYFGLFKPPDDYSTPNFLRFFSDFFFISSFLLVPLTFFLGHTFTSILSASLIKQINQKTRFPLLRTYILGCFARHGLIDVALTAIASLFLVLKSIVSLKASATYLNHYLYIPVLIFKKENILSSLSSSTSLVAQVKAQVKSLLLRRFYVSLLNLSFASFNAITFSIGMHAFSYTLNNIENEFFYLLLIFTTILIPVTFSIVLDPIISIAECFLYEIACTTENPDEKIIFDLELPNFSITPQKWSYQRVAFLGIILAITLIIQEIASNIYLFITLRGGFPIVGNTLIIKSHLLWKNTPLFLDIPPLLTLVAYAGDEKAVEYLIKSGVEPDISNSGKNTALIVASEQGYLNIVKQLINAGANVNAQSKYGLTALIVAAAEGHAHIVRELIKAKANVNLTRESGDTALLLASGKGYTEIVEILLASGAKVDAQYQNGFTPLMRASYNGHTNTVVILLKSHPNTEIIGNGNTALIWAALQGHAEIVNKLLAAGAKVEAKDQYGSTALTWASEKGYTEIVEKLLAVGADVNAIYTAQNKIKGFTSLMIACINNHVDVVDRLIKAKADVDLQNEYGSTALVFASEEGHVEIVKMLIEAGANVNAQNKYGTTALIWASEKGYSEIVSSLIRAKAEINLEEDDKDTALIRAVIQGHTKVVKLLIQAGANVNVKNKDNKTALFYAKEKDYSEIINLLRNAGATE